MKRHCSICHLPNHTKASHKKGRRGRANPKRRTGHTGWTQALLLGMPKEELVLMLQEAEDRPYRPQQKQSRLLDAPKIAWGRKHR